MGNILPLIFVTFVFAGVFALLGLRIVLQHEKGLIEFLGKYSKTVESGLVFLIPFVQSLRRIDMREQVMDVPPQEVITKDNVVVRVDAVIYFMVTDPFKVTYNVADFFLAVINLAQTALRNIIGELELDHTLTSRDKINTQLRDVLDDATDKWGVKVSRVELKAIEPPADITQAMSKQMKAEREKRALVLDAEGIRQSEILKAEGERQSKVLRAEGEKQATILAAEGKAEAIRRVAEAHQFEIETVFNAIHAGKPSSEIIALKYLEALPQIAQGTANKVFLPIEASGVLGALGGIGEMLRDDKNKEVVRK